MGENAITSMGMSNGAAAKRPASSADIISGRPGPGAGMVVLHAMGAYLSQQPGDYWQEPRGERNRRARACCLAEQR